MIAIAVPRGALGALLLALVSCAGIPPYAAPSAPEPPAIDVNGTWIGYTLLSWTELPTWLELTQRGNDVSGTLRIGDPDDVRHATFEIRGVVSGRTMQYEGTRFVEPAPGWCMTSGLLEWIDDERGVRLVGPYARSPHPGGCKPLVQGKIVIEPR